MHLLTPVTRSHSPGTDSAWAFGQMAELNNLIYGIAFPECFQQMRLKHSTQVVSSGWRSRARAREGGWSLKGYREGNGGMIEVWALEWVWACLFVFVVVWMVGVLCGLMEGFVLY